MDYDGSARSNDNREGIRSQPNGLEFQEADQSHLSHLSPLSPPTHQTLSQHHVAVPFPAISYHRLYHLQHLPPAFLQCDARRDHV